MKHYTMDKPQCLLYSAAMLLDIPPAKLIKKLGHDGMEVWWPEYGDHRQFRGHSMQEMIDIFLSEGYALTPIEAFPMQAPDQETRRAKPTFLEYAERFYSHIARNKAILIGRTERNNGHAWAWDGFKALDPRGKMCNIHDLSVQTAWVMHNINSNK